MSFWNSDLINNLEDGQLPEVKTVVVIDDDTLFKLAVTVIVILIFAFATYRLIMKR